MPAVAKLVVPSSSLGSLYTITHFQTLRKHSPSPIKQDEEPVWVPGTTSLVLPLGPPNFNSSAAQSGFGPQAPGICLQMYQSQEVPKSLYQLGPWASALTSARAVAESGPD